MSNMLPYTTGIRLKDYNELPPHLTYQQYQSMLNVIDYKGEMGSFFKNRDKLILHLLWETGGRAGDIANLKMVDFDLNYKHLKMFVKKRKKYITLPISQDLIVSYLSYLSERNKMEEKFKKDVLFDLTYQRLWQIVVQWANKAGLNFNRSFNYRGRVITTTHIHPHMFRHGLAIHLLEKGVPIPVISARLGHSSIHTTMQYYLVITPEVQRAIITDDKLKD